MPPATSLRPNGSKPRWSLLPWDALADVLGAFEYGARKYAINDWLNRPQMDHVDGAFRHLTTWMRGEEFDPETGLSHLAHAGARILMALALAQLLGERRKEHSA